MVGSQQKKNKPIKIDRCINVKKKPVQTASKDEIVFTIRGTDYKATLIFELFIAITVIVQVYLYYKYLNDPTVIMGQYNILNIVFCLVGCYFYRAALQVGDIAGLHPWEITVDQKGKRKLNFIDYRVTGFWDIALGAVLFIILLITQSLLKPLKLNVSAIDAFLFYVFSAPAEEAFFRFFLTAAPIIVGMKLIQYFERKCPGENVTLWKELTLKIIVPMITGLIFGFAHGLKYESGELFAVIVNGLEISFFYSFTKRIDIPLIAHLLVNLSFGVSILVGGV